MQIVRHYILFCAFFIAIVGSCQESVPGGVTDSLTIPGYPDETYALYLPENGKTDGPTSLLLIFDPAGRGRLAVETFIPVAEVNNHILVSSNAIQNGPYDHNLALTGRLLEHLIPKYSIDEKRIFTTGFSGGSRLAVTVAVLSGTIHGVVGCGAGFSGNLSSLPAIVDQFPYVGIVGDLDMNFQEMHKVKSWFNSIGTTNELYVFEGKHTWPPAKLLLRAFEWIRLQEMRKGSLPFNASYEDSVFLRCYGEAKEKEEAGNLPGAEEEYQRLLRNFRDRDGIDSIEKKSLAIRALKTYRKEVMDIEMTARLEDTLSTSYTTRFFSEISRPGQSINYRWWENKFEKLKKSYPTHKNQNLQKMGKRLISMIQAMTTESFEMQVAAKEIHKAIYSANVLLLLEKQEPYYEFMVAKGFAELDLTELSLDHLEQALFKGLRNSELLKSDSAFARLAEHPRFISILKSL